MSNRKKNGPSPFEIMRSNQHQDARRSRTKEGAHAGKGTMGIRGRLNEPLIIRLPRGLAMVLGFGMVGLLVLAFIVGRGYQEKTDAKNANLGGSLRDANGVPILGRPIEKDLLVVDKETSDPRKAGFRYILLAHYNKAMALDLQKFLATKGVGTFVKLRYNSRSQPSGRCFVIDLKGLKDTQQVQQRKMILLEYGKEWKQKFHSGDDLSTMYDRIYKAKNADK